MTHSLIVPAHIIGGFQAGCICGYRTRIYATAQRAANRATCHVRMSEDPPNRVRSRPAHACARCGALCADKQRHHRWHQAVDSGSTTLLPSDRAAGPETTAPVGGQANHSAPRSSGAGRPNPKDPR